MTNLADRVRGGIYGLAVGDALGATLEFMDREQIRARYGVLREVVGGGWLNLRPGEWTDDTEMALAVAEGVIKDPENPVPHIGEGFLRWRAADPPDIGATIRASFHAYDRLKDWHLAAEEVHERGGRTAGNGALMRTLPLAFAYPDAADLYVRCMEVARMTHWDPEAGLTCFIYCLTARELWSGMPFAEAYGLALDVMQDVVPRGEMEDTASRLAGRLGDVAGWPEERLKPTGYTVDTLACALWCAANAESFEGAVVRAVNLGGDADTVGAVTGGLAGVMYGYDAIPARWLDKFDGRQKERLDGVVIELVRLARKNF
ncbi:ADP-ribosylglycohydrolase family protein [Desulfofundulus thermosubterraneus]|uniref:ADP-ribosyl-[dinitrogen reductase] hydrolase n=1 Tax=Desulfofundulus thermosubterraneus DSM 16057 TaxID=1121432 RepID=A0A1M6JF77_9FIRM|nr:ADP-ribosylglycohydrolase family protein [Desulfofundulus thermosubterraneus]SHJ45367.1 ADP-ribosyl-[dinitrogen reductase] hydrolase [Desulfofundulus thermosubterraneus DSM 16057]